MNTTNPDKLEEVERAFYADNRVETANLLGMIIDAKGDTDYIKQMLDNAEEEVKSLTKKLTRVFEMVSDADNLKKLQKPIARIEVDFVMSGGKP